MANVLGSLLVELGVNMAAFHEGMSKATYTAKQTGKDIANSFKTMGESLESVLGRFGSLGEVLGSTFKDVGSTMASISGEMGSMGGVAAAAAIGIGGLAAAGLAAGAALSKMAQEGAEIVHNLEMVSAKTGIGVRDLQTLQAAGSTVGLSLDAMVMGFRRFDQAIVGVGRGSGQAQMILKQLGVTSTNSKEALLQTADAFSKMEDGPRKAADAVALFGRTGLSMIPFLDKGREGLLEFERLVDDYGPKVGKDAKEANEAFLISQTKMNLAWDSFKVSIEESVLPALTKYTNAMAEALKSTHGLASEITGHTAEAFKSFASGFQNGINTGSSLLGPLQQLANGIAGGIGGMSSAAGSHGPSEEEVQARKAADAIKLKQEAEDKALKSAQADFMLAKEGGPAAAALAKAKEEIAEALSQDTAKSYEYATAVEKTLPSLEIQAKLEKDAADSVIRLADAMKKEADNAAEQLAMFGKSALSIEIYKLGLDGATYAQKQKVVADSQAIQSLKDYAAMTKILNDQQKSSIDRGLASAIQQQGLEIDAVLPKMEMMDTTALGFGEKTNPLVAGSIKEVTDSLQQQIDAFHKVTDAEMLAKLQAEGASDAELLHVKQLSDQLKQLQANTEKVDQIWQKLGNTISQGLTNALETGKGLSKMFLDLGKQIEEAIIKEALLGSGGKGQGGFSTGGLLGGLNQSAGGLLGTNKGVGGLFGGLLGKFGIGGSGNAPDGSVGSPLHVVPVDSTGSLLSGGGPGSAWMSAASMTPGTSSGSSGGGFGGGIMSLLGLIPGLAEGGDVTPGKAYIVGEKKPELFLPNSAGRIVPNFSATPAHNTTNIAMHIHGVTDMDSFKKSQSQITGSMGTAVQRAQQRLGRQ